MQVDSSGARASTTTKAAVSHTTATNMLSHLIQPPIQRAQKQLASMTNLKATMPSATS